MDGLNTSLQVIFTLKVWSASSHSRTRRSPIRPVLPMDLSTIRNGVVLPTNINRFCGVIAKKVYINISKIIFVSILIGGF